MSYPGLGLVLLGIVLLVLAALGLPGILWTIGIILIVVGLIVWVVSFFTGRRSTL